MRLLDYLAIQNFKQFGEEQRIPLEHPAVLIGPNNCGKTTAIQALALWSQAVRTWFAAKGAAPPKQRTATALNRLSIISVPVQRTRYFWRDTVVRRGNRDIPLRITVGLRRGNAVEPVTMRFRNQGEDIVYCAPDETTLQAPESIEAAARLRVALLYPLSGLDTEEPVLQPGRIDVLIGQGQTAQVLRNLCLLIHRDAPEDWKRILQWMERLFSVQLGDPTETGRGSISLRYRQAKVKEPLDISLAGRGLQQILLLLAYLYSHRKSVLLIDEPDAHLEILRQRQIYILLRDIAAENESQVVMVTHSEAILDEALDRNLTLLLGGRADDLAARTGIRTALKHYGTEHYLRAVERRYVLYVEGRTDLDVLRSLAARMEHPVAEGWDQRLNVFFVRDNYPGETLDREIERVEGAFGATPKEHFFALREIVPELRGLALLDSDGGLRSDTDEGGLRIAWWKRYEVENYIVTPEVLLAYTAHRYGESSLFGGFREEAETVLDTLIRQRVFDDERDFETWRSLSSDQAQLVWVSRTERLKLSEFAEEFFRRLGEQIGQPMLLRKGELHRLVPFAAPASLSLEVREKLDLLQALFDRADRAPAAGAGA